MEIMKDHLIRRLINGSDANRVRADFERDLEEATATAEQIVAAREQLSDWVASTIEALGENEARTLLRDAIADPDTRARVAQDGQRESFQASQLQNLTHMNTERLALREAQLREITAVQYEDRSRQRVTEADVLELKRQLRELRQEKRQRRSD